MTDTNETPELSAETSEGIISIAEDIMRKAEENFHRDGFLVPITFMFLRRHPKTGERLEIPVMTIVTPYHVGLVHGFETPRDKDYCAFLLQKLQQKGAACAVLFLMEARVAELGPEMNSVEDFEKKHDGSLEHYPGRQERAILTMEHEALDGKLWLSSIQRPQSDNKTPAPPFLGPWKEVSSGGTGSMTGRFFGFFKPVWNPERTKRSN